MIRGATEICVFGRYVPLRVTEFRHAANDALRCMALCAAANDDDWRGRIA